MWKAIAVSLMLMPAPALAEWKVEQQGTKVMSHRDDPVGTIARLAAEAPSRDITAYLQVECFEHPPLSGKHFGVVLSKATTPGPIAYEYKFDDAAPVLRGEDRPGRSTLVAGGASAPARRSDRARVDRLDRGVEELGALHEERPLLRVEDGVALVDLHLERVALDLAEIGVERPLEGEGGGEVPQILRDRMPGRRSLRMTCEGAARQRSLRMTFSNPSS